MAKQTIGIGSAANDGTGDTLRDGAIKANSNFNELYEKLGNQTDILFDIGSGITEGQVLKWGTSPSAAFRAGNFDTLTGNLDTNGHQIVSDGTDNIVIYQTGTGDIKLWAGGSGSAYTYIDGDDGYLKWYAPYATLGDLPDATNHHGMLAHVHGTGKAYFAHSAAWVPLVDENQSITVLADVDTTVNGGPSDGQVLKWSAANSKWEPGNDLQGSGGGGGGTTQNLFETFTGDTGTTTASAANDTLNIVGGTNISTSMTGDTLTINMTGTLGDLDQNVFTTLGADNGTTTATTTTDTITFTGGSGISTNLNAGAITITNDSPNVVQNVLQTAAGDSGSYTAAAADSTITIAGGTGITTAVSGSTLTITNTVALPSAQEGQTLVHNGSSFEAVATPCINFEFSASDSNNYTVTGGGISANDPTLYVYRGFTYRFDNTTGTGHPLALRVSAGGSAISGTTGSQSSVQFWTVPMNLAAGTTYVYQCTIHGNMQGNIVVV